MVIPKQVKEKPLLRSEVRNMAVGGLDISPYASQAASIGLTILGIAVGVGSLVGLFFLLKQYRSWNIPVNIWYKDAVGNLRKKPDRGGVKFDNKADMKLFMLKKHKVGLKPDSIPFVYTEKPGIMGTSLRKEVNIWQHGLKNFAYITPHVTNPNFELGIGEEDINWAAFELQRMKNLFKIAEWKEIMAYIGFFLVVFAVLIIMYFLFQKMEVIQQAAVALENAAKMLSTTGTGTTVVTGG